ncbi:MAG: NAD-binding protein [Spirochaetaceae bacterium]|jgi:trk system potassium uptake protein TrkA|nr:NAD-binding protein [Spirochaetaceae bacterium]
MKVIITGAGMVGITLARHLTQDKNEVILIEADEERARYASNRLDCLVIHDEGNNLTVLEEAGIGSADVLICVTGSDEINIIICGIAAVRNPNLLKIARVRNDDYVRLNRSAIVRTANAGTHKENRLLGVDYFAHPNVEAAITALNAIEHNAAGDVMSFAGTNYELGCIDIKTGSRFDGLNLKDYRRIVSDETLVTLIERGGEYIIPSGQTTLAAGDHVYILANEDEMDKLFEMGGNSKSFIRKIGVIGGGELGSLIVEGLLFHGESINETKIKSFFSFFRGLILKNNRKVVIIEQDYALCKELAARFPEALTLNEDISDEHFIHEEHINGLDLIITATGNQELNIITALYLKSAGVKRAIAVVASDGYAAIARRLGIDVVIPIKSVVVDSILSRLLGGGVRSIHRLGGGVISLFEIKVSPQMPIAEKPINEFKLSSGGLVMLVRRGGESFIPHGEYTFKIEDHVIIAAKKGSKKEIEKLFGVQL